MDKASLIVNVLCQGGGIAIGMVVEARRGIDNSGFAP